MRKMILIRIALCITLNSKQLREGGGNNSIDTAFELQDLSPGRQMAFEIFLLTELLMRYNNFSPEVSAKGRVYLSLAAWVCLAWLLWVRRVLNLLNLRQVDGS